MVVINNPAGKKGSEKEDGVEGHRESVIENGNQNPLQKLRRRENHPGTGLLLHRRSW
jgi:hypothetical protein